MKSRQENKLVSIIIPAYNEEEVIGNCLKSLEKQSYRPLEVIIVDDGSSDNTLKIAKKFNIPVLKQNHQGPGPARNLGASIAKGEILVFADSDMTFDKDFVKDLTKPIIEGKTIGTFSKNEFVANKNDIWSKCWNVNRGWQNDRLFPKNSPDTSPVFRAISKKEFDKVKGFDSHGEYTDDWSLSEKLNKKAILAKDAIYYHSNPSTLIEVWKQAKWFSTNKFISGNLWRKVKSLVFYSLPMSLTIGLFKGVKSKTFTFVLFKNWFDLAVWHTVLKSLFTSKKILK